MKFNFRLPQPIIIGSVLIFVIASAHAGLIAPGSIGLQLYSLRNQLAADVPGTLAEVKGWGITNVELAGTYNLTPEQFKAQLDTHGLNAISGHFSYERFRDDVEGVARDAQTLGLKYAGCAWIPHGEPFDEKTCREAITVFNRAGEALAKQGLTFFYHVHGYEFQPYKNSLRPLLSPRQRTQSLGSTPYRDRSLLDLIMGETNPKFVNFQMDVFWIVHPGQDPVKLLKKFGSRWQLLHVKGMRDSTPTGLLTGHTDVTNDVAVGTGKIDYAPILREAKKIGVKWFIIEDESPSSEQQIPQSFHYLETLP